MAELRQVEHREESHSRGVKEASKRMLTFKLRLRECVTMCLKDEREKVKENSRKRKETICEFKRDNVCHTNCVKFPLFSYKHTRENGIAIWV